MTPQMESSATTKSDLQLYQAYLRTGDRVSLSALISRFSSMALNTALCICRNSALAEEAVQEAFLALSLKRARYEIRNRGSFKAWFLTVVTNCSRIALRTERRALRKRRLDQRDVYSDRLGPMEGDEENSTVRDRTDLAEALPNIDARSRFTIWRYFIHHRPQKDLARDLGISQQMTSRVIKEGLLALRQLMTQ